MAEKIPAWVKTWRKKRLMGLLKHIRSELLDDREIVVDVMKDLVEDEEGQKILREHGYTRTEEEKVTE